MTALAQTAAPTTGAAATATAAPTASARRVSRIPGTVGVAYTASWIAGLAVWPTSVKADATGPEVLTAFTGHQIPSFLNYALTEGLPAIGLAVVGLAVAAAARRDGFPRRARVIATAALVAASISLTQFILGAALTAHAVPSADASLSHTLFALVNRLDGVKMFALAALALAGSRVGARWLRFTAYALTVTILGSGIAFLFLLTGLTTLAYLSGPLLLAWITGSGIAQSRTAR